MKTLFTQGYRLSVAKQTLIESWVVATRPRDANGFGFSAQFAAEGIFKIKKLGYLLAETDDIYPAWESLVLSKESGRKERLRREARRRDAGSQHWPNPHIRCRGF
jgi:hypothetical protein